jgi:hypothetical protein
MPAVGLFLMLNTWERGSPVISFYHVLFHSFVRFHSWSLSPMTTRQLSRLASHVLSWDALPSTAVEIALNPLHGAATITLASNNGNMTAIIVRDAMNRRQTRSLLTNLASQMTACSCPLCRMGADHQSAAATEAAQSSPAIPNRPRIDPGMFGGVN